MIRTVIIFFCLLAMGPTYAVAGTCTFSEMQRMKEELSFTNEQIDRICGPGELGHTEGKLEQCQNEIVTLQEEAADLAGGIPREKLRTLHRDAIEWIEMPLPKEVERCIAILPKVKVRANWAMSALRSVASD